MPLTPEEAAELQSLNAQAGPSQPKAGLSAAEQQELAHLNAQAGETSTPLLPSSPQQSPAEQYSQMPMMARHFGSHLEPGSPGQVYRQPVGPPQSQEIKHPTLANLLFGDRAKAQEDLQEHRFQHPEEEGAPVAGKPPLAVQATAAPLGLIHLINGAKTIPGIGAVAGAMQGAGGAALDGGDVKQGALYGGAIGAGGSALSSLVGGVAKGFGKSADRVQQIAMGMKRDLPGAGTTAINEGVWGTRAQMAKKVREAMNDHLDTQGEAMGQIQSDLPGGTLAHTNPAASVLKQANSYKLEGDILPSHSSREYEALKKLSEEIAARPPVTPKGHVDLAKAAGNAGYKQSAIGKPGTPIDSLPGELAQAEQAAYSGALKDEYAMRFPGQPNLAEEGYRGMSGLFPAKRALEAPETLKGSPNLTSLLAFLSGIGSGHPEMGAAAAALNYGLRSPLALSLGAKAANGIAGMGAAAAPAATVAPPVFLEALRKAREEEAKKTATTSTPAKEQ